MAKFKKILKWYGLISLAGMICLFLLVGRKGVFVKNISNRLFAEEIKDRDYEGAYEIFLKAKAGDKANPSYADAIKSLEKVSQTTKDLGIKLRCYLLTTFCQFLDGDVSTSYRTGLETLNIAKKNNLKLDLLNKVISSIQNKEITELSELTFLTGEEKEATGFIKDLFRIQQGRDKYQEMAKKCWQDYFKANFDKRMAKASQEFKNSSAPTEEIEKFRKEIEEQFEKTGFFLPQELETVVSQISIKYLIEGGL